MNEVIMFLADGFEEIEALATIDILRRGNVLIKTASIKNELDVTGAHDICIKADCLLKDVNFDDYKMLILPGGAKGVENLKNNSYVLKIIKEFNKNNKLIGAICAAPSILGEVKILKNIKATCYPSFEDSLIEANLCSQNVVYDKNIITGRGAGVTFEFAFKILEILKDINICENVKKGMLI